MKRQHRGNGSIYRQTGCRTWTLQFYVNGVVHRESTHTSDKTVAQQQLRARLGEVDKGEYVERPRKPVRVEELYTALLAYNEDNKPESVYDLEKHWRLHLCPVFGQMLAASLTTPKVREYRHARLKAGAATATVNRELASLRRMFNFGYEDGRVRAVPHIPANEKENNVRLGFVGDVDYVRLSQCAPELWLRALLACAYAFGFRKGELLGLRVRQVDLKARTIRLNAGETKSGAGRVVKMTAEVFALLQACVSGKVPDDYVFTREDGQRVQDFRERWRQLTAEAECPGLLFHDLRRSAVRNMIRRGITEVIAMKISGHKTRAVFDRYNIVSEADLADAARKIEAGREVSFDSALICPKTDAGAPSAPTAKVQ
ncbi:MAG: tyrosine-type recombinase/integrase [Terriglobales bacterium]